MSLKNNYKNFDVIKVPLKGSNLIEASAGTGKTYSIAILLLRLILENKISIRQILMVTFTKAAVAELETRIRIFIKNAYRASQGNLINEDIITDLVNAAIDKNGKDQVNLLLKDAVTSMDETSVMTIHSFCQQTLNEFAFETQQLFGAELISDTSQILKEEVNKFWRKNITTIQTELLSILNSHNLNLNDIYAIVKEHLNGKQFYEYDSSIKYQLGDSEQNSYLQSIQKIEEEQKVTKQEFVDFIQNNFEDLQRRANSNAYVRNNVAVLLNNPEGLMVFLQSKRDLVNIVKAFDRSGLFEILDKIDQVKKATQLVIESCFNLIYNVAINEISAGIHKSQLFNNQLSFDDLIRNLNAALTKQDNPLLVKALQHKYKAVFIDEFQDTDRLQYEIFNTAFGKGTTLFYIGDPKQSIYSWRSADIFTYLKAKEDVDERYEMNINFRSTESYIDAMNLFFLPEDNFDTFYFGELENGIKFNKVKSPKPNIKGCLQLNDEEVIPISINNESNNKPDIAEAVAKQVANLLSDDNYTIYKDNKKAKVTPSDIGILVRNNEEGRQIKNALAQYNIPSVSINKMKVLQSPEAKEIFYVLEAMTDVTKNNINKALLTSFTGFTVDDILGIDHEKITALFKEYKNIWEDNGVYAALIRFITDFEIKKKLLATRSKNSERILTNLYHLIELLYKNQNQKNWFPYELIDWLKRGIEQQDAEGDELEQRIETDEEAVKIATIHSSKGLQYKIVLAPYLDFVEGKTRTMVNYRDPETGNFINAKKSKLTEEQLTYLRQQTEQENRRLLYVTLTRAVYKCFLFKNKPANSTLAQFTNQLNNANPHLIEWIKTPEISEEFRYNSNKEKEVQREIQKVNFAIEHQEWKRMSYTMLATKLDKNRKQRFNNSGDDYDAFIFKELTQGNITGNMLHFIFESLSFNNNEKWSMIIEKAIQRFAPSKHDNYINGLQKLLKHVMSTSIETDQFNFNLSEVDFENRIHELEFDYPVSLFNPSKLNEFSFLQQNISTHFYEEIEGMMTGKIDLFFEVRGKYFILDWKSTYLGGTIDYYTKPSLEAAMDENNYHLQYYIYTLAAKKYLELRLPNFNYEKDFGGVLYCFVRGMRAEESTGVFWTKPSLSEIKKLENLLNTKTAIQ
jgi:exodeoxyribonuclease V beta subunit